MKKSTHFDLNVYEGSDKFNPLTVEAPNMESIDKALYNNQIASVQPAVEAVDGTSHALTCATADAKFIAFTATGDYHANDLFTLNLKSVQAVLPDGSSLPEGAYRVNSTVLASIVGNKLTIYTNAGSSTAANALKLGGKPPEYYGEAANSIQIYTHSRIGTVNNFVGVGANGRVRITDNIDPGDTVQVNGKPVEAYVGADDFVETVAGADLVGRWLTFVFDGSALNFKGGSAGKVTVSGVTAENIVEGVTVTVKKGDTVVVSQEGSAKPAAAGAVLLRSPRNDPNTSDGFGIVTVSRNIPENDPGCQITFQQDFTGWVSLLGAPVTGITAGPAKYSSGQKINVTGKVLKTSAIMFLTM